LTASRESEDRVHWQKRFALAGFRGDDRNKAHLSVNNGFMVNLHNALKTKKASLTNSSPVDIGLLG
jgi:hypothetical protein